MDNIQPTDEEVVVPVATDEEVTTDKEVTEDPLKIELARVQNVPKKTKVEKLLYTKKRIEQQLKEEGIDVEEEAIEDDDVPVTVGMLKKLQEQQATKSAIQLADEVSNETERELLKYHLQNTIRSTGNPQQDFANARGLVNAVKNKQIIDETLRKPATNSHPSSAGVPPKAIKPDDELEPNELAFMRPPFNLTKAQILEARKKAQK